MSENRDPKVVVGALILNPSGQILLMTQPKWKGKFCIPGGHVEWGEKLEEALQREIKEETGLDIKKIKFFNISEYILNDENTDEKHYIFIDHICTVDNDTVLLNDEGSEYRWIKPEDSLALNLVSNTRQLIGKFIKSKKFV